MKVADIVREWKFKKEWARRRPSHEFLGYLQLYLNSYSDTFAGDSDIPERTDALFQAEMRPLRESDTVFRGVAVDSLTQMGEGANFLQRKTISFGRYTSVTWDHETAENFLRREPGKQILVMFEIETKAGAPAIVLRDYVDTSADLARWEAARGKITGERPADDDMEYDEAAEIYQDDMAFEDRAAETILNKDAEFQVLSVEGLAPRIGIGWQHEAGYYVKLRQIK